MAASSADPAPRGEAATGNMLYCPFATWKDRLRSRQVGAPDLSLLRHVSREAGRVQRDAGDDFFCLRFQVWYPSFDCAIRTRFETCDGCLNCEQGRFNLKRHRAALRQVRRLFGNGD